MPKEKDGFRDNLFMLNEKYPDKDFFSVTEVAAMMGKTTKTVRKYVKFHPVSGLVSKADLARQVSV